jgi:hypothetical protein
MGVMKRMAEEADEWRNEALAINLEANSLEECEYHDGTYFEGSEDVVEAYKLANKKISAGTIKLPNGMSRTDFTDLVKEVYEDNSGVDGCLQCEKNFGED